MFGLFGVRLKGFSSSRDAFPWHNLKCCHHTPHPLSASLPICPCWEVSSHKSFFFPSFCSRVPVRAVGSGGPNSPCVPCAGTKSPWCPWLCPVAVAQRDAENGSLFPVLIAGPRQLVKGSALCPAVPAALGCARARPLRADFGVTHKKNNSG